MATRKRQKMILGVCEYCKRTCPFPFDGVEMVRTRRGDTFYFHTLCFVKNRKKVNEWTLAD